MTGIYISFPSWKEREAREYYRANFKSAPETDLRHGAVLGFSTWETRQEADCERMDYMERYALPLGFYYNSNTREWTGPDGKKWNLRAIVDHARKAPEPKFDVIERPNYRTERPEAI